MVRKAERIEQAQETLRIVRDGVYHNAAGARVLIGPAVERAVTESVLYRDADFPTERVPVSRGLPTRVELTGETTLRAIARLYTEAPDADIFALCCGLPVNAGIVCWCWGPGAAVCSVMIRAGSR